jgi:transcriptional regulator with XRE-family HTH domain
MQDEKRPTQDQDKQQLGLKLAEARKEAGYTQLAAAQALGLEAKQTISSWEKGRNVPDALSLWRLAKLYETTLDALVGASALQGWPFQHIPLQRVLALKSEDLNYVEGQLQAALNDLDRPPPKPQTVRLGARPGRKKAA